MRWMFMSASLPIWQFEGLKKHCPSHEKIMIVKIDDAGVVALEAVSTEKGNFARLFLEDDEVKRLARQYHDVCTKTDALRAKNPESQKADALACVIKALRTSHDLF